MSTERKKTQKLKDLRKEATLLRANAATCRKRHPAEAARKENEARKIEKKIARMT